MTAEEWNALRIKLVKEGHQERADHAVGYYLRKGTTFDRSKERNVEYISMTEGSVYGSGVIETNKERWRKLDENLWQVRSEARIINVITPSVITVMSTLFVFKMDDKKSVTVVLKKYLPVPESTEAQVLKNFDTEVKEWMKLPPET